MAKRSQHVIPSNGRWRVLGSGCLRASGVFNTQREAIESARRIARNQRTELYIHGLDGRIRERDSYGKDSHPPKG